MSSRRILAVAMVTVVASLGVAPGAEAMTVEQWRAFESDGIRVGYIVGVVDAWADLVATRRTLKAKEPTPSELMYVFATECVGKKTFGEIIPIVLTWMEKNPKQVGGDDGMAAVVLLAVLESCGLKGAK